MDILKRIYELRVDRGWSEYQLAEASEISQSTISSWYRKDMLPSIGSLEKICKGLGITMSQFFDDSNGSGSLTDDQRRDVYKRQNSGNARLLWIRRWSFLPAGTNGPPARSKETIRGRC